MNTKHQQLLKIGLIVGVWLGGAACLVLIMGLLALQLTTSQAWILALLASGTAVGVALVVEMATRPLSAPEAPQHPSAPSGTPLKLETFFGLSHSLPSKELPMTVPQPPAQRQPPLAHPLAAPGPQTQIRTSERPSMKPTEKDFITRTLVQKYKLSIAVSRVVNTPDFYCYLLAIHQQETLDRLEAVLRNLGNDIYQYRRLAESVTVKLVHQFPHLQVSKPENLRRPLQWEYRPRVLAPHVTLLGASWNGPKPQPVLINLADPKQAHVALFSSTGGGKSVLLKCIVRLLEPDSGVLEVLGNSIPGLDQYEMDQLRTEVGFLFQGSALYDSMTVRENLEFPLRRHPEKMEGQDVESLIVSTLESVGLAHTIGLMPEELSGGMQRRIALARTLILQPRIILYDEPTSGLDPITSKEIIELMLKVQKEYQASALIITHDMDCARVISNRMIILFDGQNHAEGTYSELSRSSDPVVQAFFK